MRVWHYQCNVAGKRAYVRRIIIGFFLSFFSLCCIAKEVKSGYIDASGVKLYYQTFGNGDPIIVLHGGPGLDQNYLLPYMDVFSNKYAMTFYDQRGSGKSLDTQLNDKTINIQQFIYDLEAVRKQLGYKKFILMGHSWGGLLAVNYALEYPQHLKALVLINSAPITHAGFISFMNEYSKKTAPIHTELVKIENSPKFKTGDPETVENYFRTIFRTYFVNPDNAEKLNLTTTNKSALSGFKVAEILQNNYLGTNFDLVKETSKLHVPTLIIHGAHDIVPVETAKEIHSAIPYSELITLDQSAHFVYIEQPQQFQDDVNSFMDKIHD